jgi:hypothetical protein
MIEATGWRRKAKRQIELYAAQTVAATAIACAE